MEEEGKEGENILVKKEEQGQEENKMENVKIEGKEEETIELVKKVEDEEKEQQQVENKIEKIKEAVDEMNDEKKDEEKVIEVKEKVELTTEVVIDNKEDKIKAEEEKKEKDDDDDEEVEIIVVSESELDDDDLVIVSDENEKENQENERRDMENAVNIDREVMEGKTAEGNTPENHERASVSDSLTGSDTQRQVQEEKEEQEKGEKKANGVVKEEGKEEEKETKQEEVKEEEEKKEVEKSKQVVDTLVQEILMEKNDVVENGKQDHDVKENGEIGKKEEKEEEKDKKEEKEEEKQNEEEKKENVKKEKEEEKKKQKEEEKKEKEEEEKKEKEDEVDSFTDKSAPKNRLATTTSTNRVSKTVNFLEAELKASLEKRHTLSSSSSCSSYSYKKAKEEGDAAAVKRDVEEDEDRLGVLEVEEAKAQKHWTLGEGNPVYRLSMKLSPSLFNSMDIPGANQHKEADKAGFLTKLSGRSFPYIAQWKRRYCVLSKGRLYYYEREDSKAGDKTNGVIQLEYFDHVAEAGPKECKKATNVFIITSQDRSFFDPGRHVFSADTLPDMKDWIRKLEAALDQIRNNNRPAASSSPSASPKGKEGGGKRRREEAAEGKEGKGSLAQTTSSAKDRRKKKEESSRPRKSSRVGVTSQTQTSMVEPSTGEAEGTRPAMAVTKGGVLLPGFSSQKDPQATTGNGRPAERRSGVSEAKEELPETGPTLTCVTKMRVKGPQGRRAPQSRRKTAMALKKRASSLSALEHQDASDNRSESSEGASRSYRDSQTPEGDLKEETESEEELERKKIKEQTIEEEVVVENSPERQFTFDNIDEGLFFKSDLQDVGTAEWDEKEADKKKTKRSARQEVNFAESTGSPSKSGTMGKLLRFRDSFVTSKRSKFATKGSPVADHPDMVTNSRWSCVVL